MHHRTELSFVDKFRWVSPLHYLKRGDRTLFFFWCMLQEWAPCLHYHCAVVLHSCIVLPAVGHSSKHEYHCCHLTRQLSCVSNFYRTFRVFHWLFLVCLTLCVTWCHLVLKRDVANVVSFVVFTRIFCIIIYLAYFCIILRCSCSDICLTPPPAEQSSGSN